MIESQPGTISNVPFDDWFWKRFQLPPSRENIRRKIMEINGETWLKQVAEMNGKKIRDCPLYMSLVTENFLKDPKCALELGLALLMDKPIALIVIKGTKIPENLKKVAKAIEVFDPDDDQGMQRAAKALMDKLGIKERS